MGAWYVMVAATLLAVVNATSMYCNSWAAGKDHEVSSATGVANILTHNCAADIQLWHAATGINFKCDDYYHRYVQVESDTDVLRLNSFIKNRGYPVIFTRWQESPLAKCSSWNNDCDYLCVYHCPTVIALLNRVMSNSLALQNDTLSADALFLGKLDHPGSWSMTWPSSWNPSVMCSAVACFLIAGLAMVVAIVRNWSSSAPDDFMHVQD